MRSPNVRTWYKWDVWLKRFQTIRRRDCPYQYYASKRSALRASIEYNRERVKAAKEAIAITRAAMKSLREPPDVETPEE